MPCVCVHDIPGTSAHATHFVVAFCPGSDSGSYEGNRVKTCLALLCEWSAVRPVVSDEAAGRNFGIFAFAYVVVDEVKTARAYPRPSPSCLLALGGVFPLQLLSCCSEAGVLSQFYFWTVTYLRSYATQVPVKDAPAMFWDRTRAAFRDRGMSSRLRSSV